MSAFGTPFGISRSGRRSFTHLHEKFGPPDHPETRTLVDQDERRPQLKSYDNGVGFAWVEMPKEFGELPTIPRRDNAHPVWLYLEPMSAKFHRNPRRHYNFANKVMPISSSQFGLTQLGSLQLLNGNRNRQRA